MNNIPKFRVWHKELKEIFLVDHLLWRADGVLDMYSFVKENHPNLSNNFWSIELMQWTGLTDKNDKDIYEGDIVRLGNVDNYFIEKVKYTYLLSWDQVSSSGILRHRKSLDDFCQHDFEIIGNIYENRELLIGG